MKFNKIINFALASLTVLAVSCTQDVTPTGNASVGFKDSEFKPGLGKEYIYVPIVTEGESTVYPIKVQIAVEEYTGDFAAVEDVDYMITSKEILIASPESAPTVEVKIINPEDADALYFDLKIVSQENAQSISNAKVAVRCEKSELDRICGKYVFDGVWAGEATKAEWVVSSDAGMLYLKGLVPGLPEDPGVMGELVDGVIKFNLGPGTSNILGAYNFNSIGAHYVIPVDGILSGDSISWETADHVVTATPSADYKSLTFDFAPGHGFIIALFAYPSLAPTDYYYDGPMVMNNNTIIKK